MKNLFASAVLVAAFPVLSQAQFNYGHKYWEFGLMGGVMNYTGELTNSMVDIKHMHLGGGLFARYCFNKYLNLRVQGSYGTISGNDKDSRDERNQVRNLHFKSHILEVGGLLEFNFMGYHPRGHERMFSPYGFIGLAVFNYNPKAQHFDPSRDGEWVALRQYRTEGQGDPNFPNRNPYNLTQVSVPMGFGIKFAVHTSLNIGFEVGFRKTFTDYLDDVGNTYAVDLNGNVQYGSDAYRDGLFGNLSERQLMADRTYEYLVQQAGGTFGPDFPTNDQYQQAVQARGGQVVRGDKLQDWYLFSGITISYNIIDEGLVKSRKRRKKRAGCTGAQF
jgi:hypothetical protein